jgi:hypothetical protein
MIKVLVTILGCAVVAVLGGLAFIYSGIYDVSATTPDNALVAWVVHKVSDTSVGARLGAINPPTGLDSPVKIAMGGSSFHKAAPFAMVRPAWSKRPLPRASIQRRPIYSALTANPIQLKTSSSSNTASK